MAKKKTTTKSVKKATGTKKVAKKSSTKKAPAKKAKLSQLDAAVKVLASSKEPMTTKQMVEAMVTKKYWSSLTGKTPERTLYSAILREINTRGKDARFKKTDRGQEVGKPTQSRPRRPT